MSLKKPQKTAKKASLTTSKKVSAKSISSKTKPAKVEKHLKKASNHTAVKHTAEHSVNKENNSETVSLSKLGKAKIKSKKEVIPPRKIEKIIDITQLEQMLVVFLFFV